MTREELQRILSVWQQRLHLDHWDLTIRWDREVSEDNEAEIRVHDWYDQASISFHKEFEKWDERHANTTVVHELLHCFERDSKTAVEAMVNVTTSKVYELAWSRYVAGAEKWVDRLAAILVELAGPA
jgi:hypothetical protein